MGEKLVSMGSSLGSSVKFYNEFVGSLGRRTTPALPLWRCGLPAFPLPRPA
jgi:hypothetical protein